MTCLMRQVHAFDTSGAVHNNMTYYARSCRFSFIISVTPAAEPPTQTSQLYNSGAPSAHSVLRVLPLAILVAAAVLAVTCLIIYLRQFALGMLSAACMVALRACTNKCYCP